MKIWNSLIRDSNIELSKLVNRDATEGDKTFCYCCKNIDESRFLKQQWSLLENTYCGKSQCFSLLLDSFACYRDSFSFGTSAVKRVHDTMVNNFIKIIGLI